MIEWISCNERLPELSIHQSVSLVGVWDESEPVLIYHTDGRYECCYSIGVYMNDLSDDVTCNPFRWCEVESGCTVDNVIAWMPLTEPQQEV